MRTPAVWSRIALTTFVLVTTIGCWCPWCPSPTESTFSVSDVFWRAFSEPESFDSWFATEQQNVDRRAASCLRSRSSRFYDDSQRRLTECSRMESYSREWTQCHEEAEGLSNGSVLARDLAVAIEGSTRLDATEAGRYLIAMKRTAGVQLWNELITELQRVFPRIEC